VLAKQVLSQLSYTPTVEGPFILKHLPLFRIPILPKIGKCANTKLSQQRGSPQKTVPELCQLNFN
jgi:hypothetical protein